MRKICIASCVCAMLLSSGTCVNAADNKFEDREMEYTQECFTSENPAIPKNECDEFYKYLKDKESSYKKELSNIDEEKNDISENIETYLDKVRKYDKAIKDIDKQIEILTQDNTEVNDSISAMTAEIKSLLDEYGREYEQLKDKLIKMQSYIGTNYQLSFLANADSFLDYSLRKQELMELYESDAKKMKELYDKVDEIDTLQENYQTKSARAEKQKELLSDSKAISTQLKEQANLILNEYRRQESEIMGKRTEKLEDIDGVRKMMEEKQTDLANLKASKEWQLPLNKGTYQISAGAFHYPESFGGGVHLGVDLAAPVGTDVYAPISGIILYSSDNCTTEGYLGNYCGGPGANGAGNQVYLLGTMDDKMFAISFFHLKNGTPLKKGTVVEQGKKIAETGHTGNSSGPHLHMEVHYLGKGTDLKGYIDSWNGDMSFGDNWGDAGMQYTCSKNIDKEHCRLNPLELFDF